MDSRISKDRPSRRSFLRNAALGGLAALTAALVTRPASSQTCINNSICGGCGAFDDCELPQALSAKQSRPLSR
ncbi:MAG: twin-arginine translocation signal domain-containing protein [Limisphaerales bacterium]